MLQIFLLQAHPRRKKRLAGVTGFPPSTSWSFSQVSGSHRCTDSCCAGHLTSFIFPTIKASEAEQIASPDLRQLLQAYFKHTSSILQASRKTKSNNVEFVIGAKIVYMPVKHTSAWI